MVIKFLYDITLIILDTLESIKIIIFVKGGDTTGIGFGGHAD